MQSDYFRVKVDFFLRKPATKFLCAKAVIGKVVRHSFACLTVHNRLVEDVPFYPKVWANLTHPFLKHQLPIDISSCTSPVKPSKKVKLSTTAVSVMHHPASGISFQRNFACLQITKTCHSHLISHMSVRLLLHQHCHHPLLFLTSTPGSKLIFSINLFLRSSSTFPPTRLTPRTQVFFVFLGHVGFNFGIVCYAKLASSQLFISAH